MGGGNPFPMSDEIPTAHASVRMCEGTMSNLSGNLAKMERFKTTVEATRSAAASASAAEAVWASGVARASGAAAKFQRTGACLRWAPWGTCMLISSAVRRAPWRARACRRATALAMALRPVSALVTARRSARAHRLPLERFPQLSAHVTALCPLESFYRFISPQPSEHSSFPHSPRSTQAFPTALGAPKLTLQANRALPSSSPSATAMAHEKKNHAWLLRKGARIGRPGGWIGVTAPLVRMESAHLASAMPSARGMTPRRRLVSAESPSSPHPPHQGTAVPGYTARVLVPPSPWHSTPAYRQTAPHQPGVSFGLPSLPSSQVDSSFEWYVRQSSQESPFGSAAERIRPGTNHGHAAAPAGSRLARYQRHVCDYLQLHPESSLYR